MHILLTSGNAPGSAFIRWYTWGPVSHAATLLSDGCIIDATYPKGVTMHRQIYGKAAIRAFEIPGLTEAHEAAVRAFLQAQLGKPYDWGALVGMGIRRDWRSQDKWFCSELVEAAFESAGTPLLHADRIDRITPRDVLLSPLLQEVPLASTPYASVS